MWHTYITQNFTYLHVQYFTVSSSKHILSFSGLNKHTSKYSVNKCEFLSKWNKCHKPLTWERDGGEWGSGCVVLSCWLGLNHDNHAYYELSAVYKYGFYQSKMKDCCYFQISAAFLCIIWTWKKWVFWRRVTIGKKTSYIYYSILILVYTLWAPIISEPK